MGKLIDAVHYCENICKCNREHCDKSKCPILNAPTVDAVEVIRCRDCRYWDAIQNKPKRGICAPPSKAHGGYCIRRGATDDTDFCSKGERRENSGKAD